MYFAFLKAIFPLLRMLSTQHGLILFFFFKTLNFWERLNCFLAQSKRVILSARALAPLWREIWYFVNCMPFSPLMLLEKLLLFFISLHLTIKNNIWIVYPLHPRWFSGWRSCTRWENPALELLPICLQWGGNMAPQNESAKDMHAQLSAWELLVGLPNTGSERFTMCWA